MVCLFTGEFWEFFTLLYLPSDTQTTGVLQIVSCIVACSPAPSFNRILLRIKVYNFGQAPFLRFLSPVDCAFAVNSNNSLPSPRARRHGHVVFLLRAVQSTADGRDWYLAVAPVSLRGITHWLLWNYVRVLLSSTC